jgi:hypothetical protein
MPVTTLTEFHHWLLAEETTGAPFVLLQTPGDGPNDCAAKVARLLNEFDEESGGNWIALTSQVVHAIAADPAQRRLLGVDDPCPNCPPTSRCGLRKVLTAIAQRGHVVFDDALAFEATQEEPNGFRAAIGIPSKEAESFHIILNPTRFQSRCLAPLIADSFLEWTANRQRLSAA